MIRGVTAHFVITWKVLYEQKKKKKRKKRRRGEVYVVPACSTAFILAYALHTVDPDSSA